MMIFLAVVGGTLLGVCCLVGLAILIAIVATAVRDL